MSSTPQRTNKLQIEDLIS
jgi:U3 small nucleolar RNA-associated protein 14